MKGSTYHFADGNGHPVRICLTYAPSPLRPHTQRELELMYFYRVSGCRYNCNGVLITPRSGDLIAVNAGEMHACGDWGEGCVAVCAILDLGVLLPSVETPPVFESLISDPVIASAFEGLRRVLCENIPLPILDCAVYGAVYEILGALFASGIKKIPAVCTARRSAFSSVVEYITRNLSGEIRMGRLASLMHLSESRFYHAFKECFGMAPAEYIMRRRISFACVLLSESDISVTEASEASGFCTAAYFSSVFKRYMGCTPRAYRARLHASDRAAALDVTEDGASVNS